MKRNSLTPTVITDKNGKVTTVHKKGSVAPSGKAPMPSPSIKSQDDIRELAGRFSAAVKHSHGRYDAQRIKRFLKGMEDLAEAFVEQVEKAVKDTAAGTSYGSANLSYLILAFADNDMGCRRTLKYHKSFPDNLALTDARFVLRRIVEAYGGDTNAPEYAEQVRAHLYAASNYQRPDTGDYSNWDYETNEDLFGIIMKRPGDVEEIMRLHNDYKVPKITDEIIEEYRKHPTSLGHGVL